jgi:recombination protein RecT
MAANTDRARAAVARTTEQTTAVDRPQRTLKQAITDMQAQFQRAMPRGAEADRLIRDALTCLSRTPTLEKCQQSSVLGALMTCAQLGLRPGVLGHAWLLPFFDSRAGIHKAQLVIGYQGYAELAHRTGLILSLIARPVYEHDEFSVDYGLADSLVHRPRLFGGRGDVIAYYAIIKYVTGGHAFLVMSRSDVERHRDRFAMARNKKREVIGPWADHFDAMALKTVYLQLQKWAPKATETQNAMAADGSVRTDLDPGVLDAMPPLADDVIDGEAVDEPAPAANGQAPEPEPAAAAEPAQHARGINAGQQKVLHATLGPFGLTEARRRDDKLALLSDILQRPVDSSTDLSADEASMAIDQLGRVDPGEDGRLEVAQMIEGGRVRRDRTQAQT